MKKERKTKAERKNKPKRHSNSPHIAARFVAAVLAAALSVNGFYAYQMFGRGVEDAVVDAGLNRSQAQLQVEMEEREEAKEAAGFISYTPSGAADLNRVILDGEDAAEVFEKLRYGMDLIDLDDTFPLAYTRTNDYFDVYTLQQYHQGIEVYGHEIKMTADKAGNLLSVTGNPVELTGFDTTVMLHEEDAYGYVEKYLKSESKLTAEDVRIEGKGKRIAFDEQEQPVMGYLFEVMAASQTILLEREIVVNANRKSIIFDHSCIAAEMVTLDRNDDSIYQRPLGQQGLQTIDIWKESETEFVSIDKNRNIMAHRELFTVNVDWYGKELPELRTTDLISLSLNHKKSPKH